MRGLIDFQTQWEALVDKYTSTGYESLSDVERVWFDVQSLVTGIENGGFISYFFNPGGDHAHDAMRSLDAISAPTTKALLQRMIDLYPQGEVPADIEVRNAIIESWDEDAIDPILEDIDESFFNQDEKPEELLVDFLQNNGVTTQQ